MMEHSAALGFTEEQANFIRDQIEKAHPRFEELQQKLQTELEALGALLKEKKIDEQQVLAQLDKLLKQEREIKRMQLTLLLSLKNRLTPEQQSKLQEIKKRPATVPPPAPSSKRLPPAIPEKLEKVKTGVERWQNEGRDPSAIAQLMQEFSPLMQEGKFKEAEALLDRALKQLENDEKSQQPKKKSSLSLPSEVKEGSLERLLLSAEGNEVLQWKAPELARKNPAALLPAGRPIAWRGKVRYGIIGEASVPE